LLQDAYEDWGEENKKTAALGGLTFHLGALLHLRLLFLETRLIFSHKGA
jgi:hypothetical protein